MIVEQPKLVMVRSVPVVSIDPIFIRYADVAPDIATSYLAVNADSIGISIYNLLTTNKGERMNLPEYGIDLEDYLFEIMDSNTEHQVLTAIYTAIRRWEPRVEMDVSKSFVQGDTTEHKYHIELFLQVLGLGDVLLKYTGTISRIKTLFETMYSEN